MKEFKGTKGEWIIEKGYKNIFSRRESDRRLDVMESIRLLSINHYAKSEEEIVANAQLIAAAPDMLEALQETDKDLCVLEGTMFAIEKKDPRAEGMMEMVRKWRKRNQEAINKALGE